MIGSHLYKRMVTITRTTDIEKVTDIVTAAFTSSAFTAFVIRTPESTWPVDNIPKELLRPLMLAGTTTKAALGGELVEAGNYAAVAIWFVSSDCVVAHLKTSS